jgi:hypothetical protein
MADLHLQVTVSKADTQDVVNIGMKDIRNQSEFVIWMRYLKSRLMPDLIRSGLAVQVDSQKERDWYRDFCIEQQIPHLGVPLSSYLHRWYICPTTETQSRNLMEEILDDSDWTFSGIMVWYLGTRSTPEQLIESLRLGTTPSTRKLIPTADGRGVEWRGPEEAVSEVLTCLKWDVEDVKVAYEVTHSIGQ